MAQSVAVTTRSKAQSFLLRGIEIEDVLWASDVRERMQ